MSFGAGQTVLITMLQPLLLLKEESDSDELTRCNARDVVTPIKVDVQHFKTFRVLSTN